MVGTILHDRYEIINEIGTGGMATVYLAYCRVLKRKVAIKVLNTFEENGRENLLIYEAKAIARVNHPNIVQVYDIFEDDEKTYIVMEYVSGITLKELLRQQAPLPEEDLIEYSQKLAQALAHAHQNGVIHRDIKPENIIIDRNHEPKITDFGIAHVSNENTIIRSDQVFGSLRYASPEQLKGNVIDERSDIYSLGVVMYEMATASMPFPDESPVTAAFRKLKEPLPNVLTLNPHLSERVSRVILRATAIDPQERYRSMGEIYNDLKDQKEPVTKARYTSTKTPPTPTYREERMPRQKKTSLRPLFMGMLVAFILSAIILLAALGMKEPTKPDLNAPNVQNMSVKDAKVLLNKEGFLAAVISTESSKDVPRGSIIRYEVVPYKEGEKPRVNLIVSSGKNQAEIPSFINLTKNEAIELASKKGLRIEWQEAFDDHVELDHVIRQSIDIGELVEPETSIELTVSKGKEILMVKVPYLINETFIIAKTKLESVKLETGSVEYEYSNDIAEGNVMKQSVEADTELEEGSKIDLVISKGKEKKDTPTEPKPPVVQTNEPGEIEMRLMAVTLDTTYVQKDSFLVTAEYITDGKTVQVYSKNHKKSEQTIQFNIEGPRGAAWKVRIDGKTVQQGVFN
ncbi:protein kinase domain-containing protein [Guggenheimella bovis]